MHILLDIDAAMQVINRRQLDYVNLDLSQVEYSEGTEGCNFFRRKGSAWHLGVVPKQPNRLSMC